jgi:flavorubredoxin
MRVETLFKNNTHNWMVMGRDPDRHDDVIDTNHYLIQHNGRGLLLDPGGLENFAVVAAEFSGHFDIADLEAVFATHQDPDVISSIPLWVQANPRLAVYVPKIWANFITHAGVNPKNIRSMPDDGGSITLGGHDLDIIPAHYLHSPGNVSLYDPDAKILYSGDIGSAILPKEESGLFVEDFTAHIAFMDYFHRRWMPSNTAKSRWIAEVRKRDVDMLCPQHGSIFRGEDVGRFLTWFENLDVGSGWSNVR